MSTAGPRAPASSGHRRALTSSPLGPGLRYNVTLDERRPGARAAFDDASQKRTVQRRLRAAVGRRVCQSHPFHVFVSRAVARAASCLGVT